MAFEIKFDTGDSQEKSQRLAETVQTIGTAATGAARQLALMVRTTRNFARQKGDIDQITASFRSIARTSQQMKKLGDPESTAQLRAGARAMNSIAVSIKSAAKDAEKFDRLAAAMDRVAKSSQKIKNFGSDASSNQLTRATQNMQQYHLVMEQAEKAAFKLDIGVGTLSQTLQSATAQFRAHSRTVSRMAKSYEALSKSAREARLQFIGLAQMQKRHSQGYTLGNTAALNASMIGLIATLRSTNAQLLKASQANVSYAASAKVATAATRKQTTATAQSSKTLKEFNTWLHGGDQASAAMRASLNASGSSIGIFTGRTIVAATAFYGFVGAIRSMLTTGAEFTKEMIRANAILGATEGEAKQLEGRVRNLAETTVFTAVEVAKGLQYLAMAGLSAKEAFYALAPTLDIAKIGLVEFSEAADIVTNVMRAFQLRTHEVSKVADVLAVAITNSNATLKQLAQSLTYVAPIAAAAGDSLENTSAILAVMHDVGIKATRAGTALRRAYSNLLAPAGKVSATLQSLGVVTVDANGHMKDMITIMRDLARNGATASDMVKLFGVRAAPAMVNLLRDLQTVNPKVDEMAKKLKDSAGAAKDLGATIEEHLGADAQKLISAITEKLVQIFEINAGDFRSIIQNLTEQVRAFDVNRLQNIVKDMTNFADAVRRSAEAVMYFLGVIIGVTVLRTFASIVSFVTGTIGTLSGGLAIATKRLLEFKAASMAAQSSMGILGPGAAKSAKKMAKVGGAAGMAARAMGMFGRVLGFLSGPVGWIITALSIAVPLYSAWADGHVEATKKVKDATEANKEFNEELEKQNKLYKVRGGIMVSGISKTTIDEGNRGGASPAAMKEMENIVDSWVKNTQSVDVLKRDAQKFTDSMVHVEKYYLWKMDDLRKRGTAAQVESARQEMNSLLTEWERNRNDLIAKADEIQKTIQKQKGQIDHFNETGVTPRGAQSKESFQRDIDAIEGTNTFDSVVKDEQRRLAVVTGNLNKLESIGVGTTPEDARDQIKAASDRAISAVQAEYQRQESILDIKINELAQLMQLKKNDAGKFTVGEDSNALFKEPFLELLTEKKELREALGNAVTQFETGKDAADIEHLADVTTKFKFDSAAEDLAKYNAKLKETIKTTNDKLAVDKGLANGTERFIKASERARLAEAERLLLMQETEIQRQIQLGTDSAIIAQWQDRKAMLEKEIALMRERLKEVAKAREEQAKFDDAQSEFKRLSKGAFFKGDSKIAFDHAKDLKDLKDYYMKVEGLSANDLEKHKEYLKAKEEIDLHYWLKSHKMMSDFFDSLGQSLSTNISQVLTYQQTWDEASQNIRNAILGSIIGSLVELGVQQIKMWLAEKFFEKSKQAEIMTTTAMHVAGEGAKAQATATSTAAQASSATAANGSIAAMIGDGAAMAAAWIPAAWAVTVANYGANMAPAIKALLATAGATVGAVGIVSAAGMAATAAMQGLSQNMSNTPTARVMGGRVEAGSDYYVGEGGRERFVPDQNGSIIPAHQLRMMEAEQGKRSPLKSEGDGEGGMGSLRIINAIDPELLDDYLGSDSAEKVIMNVIRKNRG